MRYYKTIKERHKKVKCMVCKRDIPKSETVFMHVSSAYMGNIHRGCMCLECQLEIIFKATGKKYLKKSVIDKIIARRI